MQKPHPPLLVGGRGTRGTAEPAARFADEYNTPFATPDEFAAIRAKVAAACERAGRDPATMRFSLMTGCLIGATRDEAFDRARELYGRRPREPPSTTGSPASRSAASSARSTRWPSGYATTSAPAAGA